LRTFTFDDDGGRVLFVATDKKRQEGDHSQVKKEAQLSSCGLRILLVEITINSFPISNLVQGSSVNDPCMTSRRTSLNGAWILDKTKVPWSMNNYLRVMKVDDVAIEAHEKGELEFETFHTITMDEHTVKIVKRSRVNNDFLVDLEFGKEQVVFLPPNNRPRRSLATTEGPGQLKIIHSLQTYNTGRATVTDTKVLQQDDDKSFLVQELSIVNEMSGEKCTTIRHFVPYLETPPHLVVEEAKEEIPKP
jgi:hypothetical protein